jgi:dUTP pyrophosphatase
VLVKRLDPELPLPAPAHPGDAGLDLRSTGDAVLPPAGGRATVGTGLALALPAGCVALVHPRSGLAAAHGVTVLNAPGTVDAGYRGEIKVTLLNTDPATPFEVRRGDRIAQVVFQEFLPARLVEVERLPGSARGEAGFGSTGRKD